jgi:23S rRNA pseudouridine955/2504/2580 synthase
MYPVLLVGIGGALGSIARYLSGVAVGRVWPSSFPLATMLINITGSLIMGLFIGWLARTTPAWQADARLFFAIGVLGGFTTLSSFLARHRRAARARRGRAGCGLCDGLDRRQHRRAFRRVVAHAYGHGMSGTRLQTVGRDEDGMRLDRWFGVHFPQVTFGHLQKLIRTGQVRIDSGRAKTNSRLEAGQQVRIPPLDAEVKRIEQKVSAEDAAFLRDLILYEDDELYVFNKPHGLASQGGSGTKRHMDGLLKSLPNKQGEAPRLVHRLDRDTSGVLVVAKTRAAAAHFGKVFQSRGAQKIYWAVVYGVPTPQQGSISCFLAKQIVGDNEQMVVVEQNHPGAQHSKTFYSVTDTAARRFSWVTLKPVTGRTHQLRVHMQQLRHPIMGDPRYFDIENFQGAPGLGEGLHLHARRIRLPLRSGKLLDVSAPLPPHMVQSFEALGFDADRYDVREQDPEE